MGCIHHFIVEHVGSTQHLDSQLIESCHGIRILSGSSSNLIAILAREPKHLPLNATTGTQAMYPFPPRSTVSQQQQA